MKHAFPLIIEQGEQGLFGYFPDLPGIGVSGGTRDEVVQHAQEALAVYLADYEEKGLDLPKPTRAIDLALVEVEDSDLQTPRHAGHG